jgi:plasmid maintenance system antidote protein VapI
MIQKFKENASQQPIQIGEMLKNYFTKNRIYKSALARLLHRKPDTILGYQKKASIQTAILWEISVALQHNFFADIACQLPSTYSSNAPINNMDAEKIAALEKQLMLVSAERDVLLRALKKE